MKIPCSDCGVLILQETAERNGGRCMPCRSGTRAQIEASKIAAKSERELDATDPIRIYWRYLVDTVYKTAAGLNALSEHELQYWAVGCLSGEVYNGGFDQYFHNSSASTYHAALRGLEAMGAVGSLLLLQKAKQIVFGFQDVPENTSARRDFLANTSSDSRQQRLDELDRQFWADPDKLAELCEEFAVRHGLVRLTAQQGAPVDGLRPPLS